MSNNNSGQLDFMHWVWRLIAYVIDSIIVVIPTLIIYFVLVAAIVFSGGSFAFFGLWLIFPLIFGVIDLLYFIVLDVAWGGTIGKRLLGLQVQTVSGGKVDVGKAFIRNISKIYWLLLLLDWIIGMVTAGDKRQKLTDRWAGTIVVQIRPPFRSVSMTPP